MKLDENGRKKSFVLQLNWSKMFYNDQLMTIIFVISLILEKLSFKEFKLQLSKQTSISFYDNNFLDGVVAR